MSKNKNKNWFANLQTGSNTTNITQNFLAHIQHAEFSQKTSKSTQKLKANIFHYTVQDCKFVLIYLYNLYPIEAIWVRSY